MEIAVERVFTKEILARAAKAFHVTVEKSHLEILKIIFLRQRVIVVKITYYV